MSHTPPECWRDLARAVLAQAIQDAYIRTHMTGETRRGRHTRRNRASLVAWWSSPAARFWSEAAGLCPDATTAAARKIIFSRRAKQRQFIKPSATAMLRPQETSP